MSRRIDVERGQRLSAARRGLDVSPVAAIPVAEIDLGPIRFDDFGQIERAGHLLGRFARPPQRRSHDRSPAPASGLPLHLMPARIGQRPVAAPVDAACATGRAVSQQV